MKLKIWQVDAFASKPLEGNPAAVVPLESWLEAELMQAIAAENNVAETAYFVKTRAGAYDLRWFAPNIADATVASVQLVVRKCAHLTEYAILAALLYRAFREYRDRVFGLAFLIAALYAVLDEFHQSFVASRTASPWDVVIDCAGAVTGLLVYLRIDNARRRSSTRPSW